MASRRQNRAEAKERGESVAMELRTCVNCGHGPYASRGKTVRCPSCNGIWNIKGRGQAWRKGLTSCDMNPIHRGHIFDRAGKCVYCGTRKRGVG